MPPDLSAALDWCQHLTRTHSHTFYRGSLLYPARQRQAVWVVYAACRVGDDLVDSGRPADEVQHALDDWWKQVQATAAGHQSESEMQTALSWAFANYAIPLSAFCELYEGFRMDVRGHRYDTLADLEQYCQRVAGVVGYLIAPIGGFRGGEATLRAALSLGKAMQLTNILRDVGEDLALGRLYLPQELLHAYQVDLADLWAGRVTPEYRALLRHLEGLARDWYSGGVRGIPQLEGQARYGVAVAARLYAGILDELRSNDYDNLTRRAVVGKRRKLWLTLSVWQSRLSFGWPQMLAGIR